MGFDPFNLLLLAIAAIVFWRLRAVLGTRTGNERPPFDPAAGRTPKGDPANGNVLRFPREENAEPKADVAPTEGETKQPVWTGVAEAGSPLALSLDKVAAADPSFTPRAFLDGARVAYEMIIEAFDRGDKQALKPLLSKEVFDGFSRAIDQREEAGHRIDSRFVGIDEASMLAAELEGRKVRIAVRFVSQVISATLNKASQVVDGDPKLIRSNTDIWTFERDTSSRDPNWKLVATEEPA